jgi:Protein of unknown function (DUF4012)
MWAARWRSATGETIDGAIALDPATLSYLLQVTGPVTLADGTTLGADNVVDFVLRNEYARYPGVGLQDQQVRKQVLVGVAQGVLGRVLVGAGSARDLLPALGRAAHSSGTDYSAQSEPTVTYLGAAAATRAESMRRSVHTRRDRAPQPPL